MPSPGPGALGTRLMLAIESSCDETSAAVVREDNSVLSNVVASQTDLHERFGGVVPELASRAHVERILPVIDEALRDAQVDLKQIDLIAVMTEPGLVGSLLIGLTAAKTLAWVLDVPLVAVNHVEAHLYACRLQSQEELFPAIGLVVSGGHSNLYDCRSPIDYELIGSTIDDAAGEAFDKVAAILNLPYPGGPSIEKAARDGDASAIPFPRPLLHDERLAFSFSGLKTAVLYEVRGKPGSREPVPPLTPQRTADIAASFQEAVVDVLVGKCRQALRQCGRDRLLLGGGVAANALLRSRLEQMADEAHVSLSISPMRYCTDNAAMAALGWERFHAGMTASLDIDVKPGLVRA